MGRIVAWDELSLFGIWDELSLGTNCHLGRIVTWDELSPNRVICVFIPAIQDQIDAGRVYINI